MSKRTTNTMLVLIVLLWVCGMVLMFPGCAAPPQVQVAQSVKARALKNYLTNDAKIDNVVVGLWKGARTKQIKATATGTALKVLDALGKPRAPVDADGKPIGPAENTLTAAQALELSMAIHEAIQSANAGTDAVLAKIAVLRNANAAEMAKVAQLEGALNEYLQAGVEEAVLTELTSYLVQTIEAQVGKEK